MMKLGFLFSLFSVLASATLDNGHWEILKTKNETSDRSECGLATVNGKIYLLGGDGGSKHVEVFDPISLTWTKKAAAPIIMHHFQAVALGNKIYVLQAFSEGGFPNQISMANVYSYDTEKNVWEKGAEVPADRRRAGAGTTTYNGKLYLVAGIQHGHASGTTNMFDEFDPQTNTWTKLPNAPHIRDHCSATVIHNKLYVVGGRNTSYHEPDNFMAFFSHTVTEVDCYDFVTEEWTTLMAKLPLGSGGGAVVNYQDKLFYMGGERATATTPNAPQKNTYYLDPSSSNEWIETENMNKGRNGMAAVVMNNKIYAVGGSGGGPVGPPPALPKESPGDPPPPDNTDRPAAPPPGQGPGGAGFATIEVYSL